MGVHYTDIDVADNITAGELNDRLDELDAAIDVVLTNKSGGALAANDCVIIDPDNDDAVDTTTSAASTKGPGIVVSGGADSEDVHVRMVGRVAVVVDGAATRGQYIKTSTTAKQVTPTSSYETGVFGILTTASSGGAGTTANAVLFGGAVS